MTDTDKPAAAETPAPPAKTAKAETPAAAETAATAAKPEPQPAKPAASSHKSKPAKAAAVPDVPAEPQVAVQVETARNALTVKNLDV